MRVDVGFDLYETQRRIVAYDGVAPLCVSGPSGSGKTTVLAARAVRLAARKAVAVVCPHASSCEAFGAALAGHDRPEHPIVVDTIAGHAAAWMRGEFIASAASPTLIVGSDLDSEALVRVAGSSILDMSWPGFREPGFTLDLPFLGRPDVFFEEAAGLFRQLRRWNIGPEEFEVRCAAGLAEFYGDDVERARVLCADPQLRSRASSRGREAMSADISRLRSQKRAERELAKLLAFLYREYRAAAPLAPVLCGEDAVDEALQWLQRDTSACGRVADRFAEIIVDDAEDSEPATAKIIDLLRAGASTNVTVAYCESAAIDGIGGRRALLLGSDAHRIDLAPSTQTRAARSATRFADEGSEADAIAADIRGLFGSGAAPRDIMVLARDDDAASVYSRQLAERGIPVIASPSAWQAPRDIADILALASVVDDPYDHAHLLRVLASPLVGLSDLSVLTLCGDPIDAAQLPLDVGLSDKGFGPARGVGTTTLADNVLYGRVDLKLNDGARASLMEFRARWLQWRKSCARLSAPAAIAYLIEAAGFKAAWHAMPHHLRTRLADDGRRLVAAAARSQERRLIDVARSLEGGLGCIGAASESDDAVTCRPVIEAKGIRKPYVFVAGIAHERFPRIYVSRAMAYSKKYGLIVRENVAGGASQTAKFAWYYAKFGAKNLYIEGERRVLSYALSRADVAVRATGFGKPPRWAAEQDLLTAYGA